MNTPRSAIAPWADQPSQTRLLELESRHHERGPGAVAGGVHTAQQAHHGRLREGIVLYAGTNVLSPAVQAAHDGDLATRPSLGWPGGKVQTGVQEIEDLEVIASTQVARSLRARYAEVRFLTATMANLALYIAFAQPGDSIAVLSPEAGGHASHHAHGTAGIRGLTVHHLPYDGRRLDVDANRLTEFVDAHRPRIILVGGSVTLFPHDLGPLRAAADRVEAILAYDASHVAGLIAAGFVQDPLAEGADVVTFSTYKTYGGPAGGAAVTDRADLAERISHAAYPVLSSNYDPARLGPLAIAAAEALDQEPAWAAATVTAAQHLAGGLASRGLPVLGAGRGYTTTHQVVVDVHEFGGGGQVMARLEQAGVYTGACRLPWQQPGTPPQGLRLGTQEIVRRGATLDHLPALTALVDDLIRGGDHDPHPVRDLAGAFGPDLWGRTDDRIVKVAAGTH